MVLTYLTVPEDHLFDSLQRLNQIGRNINHLFAGDLANLHATLELIVQSATEVVPGSSAVIYAYDESSGRFDLDSRVSFEGVTEAVPDDFPRPYGMGSRAVRERRRIISSEEVDLGIHPRKTAVGAKEMVCYPLMVKDEVLGVLYVYLHDLRQFSQLELLMLDNFVNQAAITLSLSQQVSLGQEKHIRKDKELRRLRRAGTLISSRSGGVQALMNTILVYALEVMDAQFGTFRLVDDSGKYLVNSATIGVTHEGAVVDRLSLDRNSIMGIVALEKQPLVISDLREQPWCDIYFPFDHNLEMRSELTVPLLGASNRLEGVLNLESPQVGAFSKQDRYILQIFATQAVSAIQEARVIDAIQEISAILLTQSRQEVLDHLVDQASNLLNAHVGLLWLFDNNQLVLQSATDGRLCGERLAIENSFTGEAITTRQPVVSQHILEDPRFQRKDLAAEHGWGRALSVPIMASGDDTPSGVLSIYTHLDAPRDFDLEGWDVKVMTILAHYAALAVQNAARQEDLQNAREQHAVAEMFAVVGDMAANLMHRLNNKVGTIPVRVEGIEDKYGTLLRGEEYLAHNLAEIQNSAAEAMRIVQESLFHLKPVSLNPVNIDVCVQEGLSTALPPEDVQIHVNGVDTLPVVLADRVRVGLVFTNLIENAVTAMDGHGVIRIEGAVKDDWVEVCVSDSGPGIPPELHEQIFEFRYSGQRSEHPGKLGFGLWWVKTLMVRMKGNVSVDSDGQHGTTFTLRFPNTDAGRKN